MGIDLGATELAEEAVALGYSRGPLSQAMRWTAGRIALRTGIRDASEITDEHITEAPEAVRLFSDATICTSSIRRRRTTATTAPSSGSPLCTGSRCSSTEGKSPPSRAS